MNITLWQLILAMGIPSAITAFCFGLINRKIDKRNKEQDEKEAAREQNQLLLIQNTRAAMALGEATARAVQRIPDAHCNGDMHAALAYAEKVKHEQKDFLTKQGLHHLYD